MDSDNLHFAMSRAEALLRAGNHSAAIEPLRDVLSADPEHAYAHLLLSRALMGEKRIEAARYEADRAAEIDPQWAAAHIQRAQLLLLKQGRKEALGAVEQAIALAPQSSDAHLLKARILRMMDKRSQAAASLDHALQLDPVSTYALAEKGYGALADGDNGGVEMAGRAILDLDPTHVDGIVLIGHAQLARGDHAEALRLALAALSADPVDPEALHLLASVKVKTNPLGGLWWRWNRLLVRLGIARAIFLIVGIWVSYRLIDLVTQDMGADEIVGMVLTGVYLAFVIYTLSADTIVRRMVDKELAKVRLRPDF